MANALWCRLDSLNLKYGVELVEKVQGRATKMNCCKKRWANNIGNEEGTEDATVVHIVITEKEVVQHKRLFELAPVADINYSVQNVWVCGMHWLIVLSQWILLSLFKEEAGKYRLSSIPGFICSAWF